MTSDIYHNVFMYVVARDFGFAPNPYHGFCTLACCKPKIRSAAKVGDWVFGIAGAKLAPPGKCVFGMRVDETMPFEDYWKDERFIAKRPVRNGSRAMMLGDNIYHRRDNQTAWEQEDSHHSRPDGLPDESNIAKDTGTNRVLISCDFCYFGDKAPEIPKGILEDMGYSNGIGHRKFEISEAGDLIHWFCQEARKSACQVAGDPFQFRKSAARYSSASDKIIEEEIDPISL